MVQKQAKGQHKISVIRIFPTRGENRLGIFTTVLSSGGKNDTALVLTPIFLPERFWWSGENAADRKQKEPTENVILKYENQAYSVTYLHRCASGGYAGHHRAR